MSRAFRWLLVGMACLAVVALVSGRGHWFWPTYSAEQTINNSFVVESTPRVVVETFNGSVEIHTGLSGRVSAAVTKNASGFSQEEADANLENIDVQMAQEGDTIRVTARRFEGPGLNLSDGAAVKLDVPPGAILDLKTSNGRVAVHGPAGKVVAQSSNGQIQIVGTKGEIHAQTSNGRIKIDADATLVEARSSNGGIEYRGQLGNRDHTFHTSNGRITLALPAESQFRFDARTSNGRITNKFKTKENIRSKSKQQSGTVGDNPTCRITIQTSNGGIDISPAKDIVHFDDDDDD